MGRLPQVYYLSHLPLNSPSLFRDSFCCDFFLAAAGDSEHSSAISQAEAERKADIQRSQLAYIDSETAFTLQGSDDFAREKMSGVEKLQDPLALMAAIEQEWLTFSGNDADASKQELRYVLGPVPLKGGRDRGHESWT